MKSKEAALPPAATAANAETPEWPGAAAQESATAAEPASAMPLPQGGATRKALIDLLYESDKQGPAPEKRDEVCGGPGIRQLRERRTSHRYPFGHDDEPEAQVLEPCTRDAMLIVPPVAAAPLGGAARKLAWSANDIPLESGDRLHRIAVVANNYIEPLRPPKMERPNSLPPLRPKSKAECERRCGSDGFCDPSDPLGCGGVHCGRPRDILS